MNGQEVVHCTARAEATENLMEHEPKSSSEQHMQVEPLQVTALSNPVSEKESQTTRGMSAAKTMEHETKPPSDLPQGSERHHGRQESTKDEMI